MWSSIILIKDLYEKNQINSHRIVKDLNESLVDLRNSVNGKEIPKNENPNKLIDNAEKKFSTSVNNGKIQDSKY